MRNGCRIYFLNKKPPYEVSYSLDDILTLVPDEKFCRVHNSFVVCLQHLTATNKQNTRIIYSNELFIPVSEKYHPVFVKKARFLVRQPKKIKGPSGHSTENSGHST